jgi:HSP20 family protein
MKLMRYSPIDSYDLPAIPHRFSDMLDEFFTDALGVNPSNAFTPRADISEDDKAYHIELVLPGMKKSDININVEGNHLTVSGERKFEEKKETKKYHLVESGYGKFTRSFALNDDVKENGINAHFENGILKIDLEKREEKVARQIEIK